MTNDNIIEIKTQDKNWLLKGILYLLGMLFSLFIAMLPLISGFAKANSGLFCAVGSIFFIIFITLFCFLLYRECKPGTALRLSAHSFVDLNNIGEGIEIEWTNVSAVKLLGKANMQFLGVTLENTDIIIEKMNKKKSAEIIENIEQNLPTILIPQSSVRIQIKDLKNIFVKFAREARALESDTPKKPKNNPFTTDDVLRAFGQLPKEISENEPQNSDPLPSPALDPSITRPFEIPDDIVISETVSSDEATIEESEIAEDAVDNVSEPTIVEEESIKDEPNVSTDSFYEMLRSKAAIPEIANEDEADNDNDNVTDEEIPEEQLDETEKSEDIVTDSITDDIDSTTATEDNQPENNIAQDIEELLAQAKSSRITELEKILTDEDVPYSIAREEKSIADDQSNGESNNITEVIEGDETVDDTETDGAIEVVDSVETMDVANDQLEPEIDDSTLESRLDSLIASAIVTEEQPDNDSILNHNLHATTPHDANTDTKEFIIDLSKAIDSKANSDD